MNPRRNVVDIAGGAALGTLGLWFSFHALNYNLGSVARLGPGFFPFALGLLAALVGGLIVLAGVRAPAEPSAFFAFRPLLAILAGLVAFAICLERFGLIPAVFLAFVFSALGDRSTKPVLVVLFAAIAAVVAWLIFRVGLELPTPGFAWEV